MINDQQMINNLLINSRTVALVGASHKPHRDSYRVMQALQQFGLRVVPINPRMTGQMLLGEKVYSSLSDLPMPIDFVDLFINSQAAADIIDEAIACRLPALWMQLGVVNLEAAHRAIASGLNVVMDRCPLIEIAQQKLEHSPKI